MRLKDPLAAIGCYIQTILSNQQRFFYRLTDPIQHASRTSGCIVAFRKFPNASCRGQGPWRCQQNQPFLRSCHCNIQKPCFFSTDLTATLIFQCFSAYRMSRYSLINITAFYCKTACGITTKKLAVTRHSKRPCQFHKDHYRKFKSF